MMRASSRSYYSRPSYRFLPSDHHVTLGHDSFELNESDLYSSVSTRSDSPEFRSPRIAKRLSAKRIDSGALARGAVSLPVNIPDWSKILKEEYRENWRSDSEDEDVEGGNWIRPHEFLARTRIASFSVHEGIGGTLKGRDLREVRMAASEGAKSKFKNNALFPD